jgi:putative transposase
VALGEAHVPARSAILIVNRLSSIRGDGAIGAAVLGRKEWVGRVGASRAAETDLVRLEGVEGVVERVTFHNPENGFSVLRVRVRGRREACVVVGTLPAAQPGERLIMAGRWRTDPRHGVQFRAEAAEVCPPATRDETVRYLGSGLIPQLGPTLAARIVAHFGDATLAVLDTAPARVREVPGIGPTRAAALAAAWEEHRALRAVSAFLTAHKLDARYAPRLVAAYGVEAPRVLGANPYRLVAEIPGLGFRAADRLGRDLGVREAAPARLQATVHAAALRAGEAGHTRTPRCPGRKVHPGTSSPFVAAARDCGYTLPPSRVAPFTKEEPSMPGRLLRHLITRGRAAAQRLRRRLLAATRPAGAPLLVGTLADLARCKPALVTENALLRHQLAILHRSVKRPRCTPADRALLVLLASRVRTWQSALLIVQPATLLRWHRQLFRGYWRRRSRAAFPAHRPPLATETVALIREMATANRLWGAERIRGELLKLDIRVARSTIQRYLREARPPRRTGQSWATFLKNHAPDTWACDFLPVTDLLFRPVYAFFVIALESRRVIHVGVTRHPTDAWVAQQLRAATPFDQRPRCLIRDNDGQFGAAVARVAEATDIAILRTPYRAPRANATCERFLGRVRRECLDHLLVLGERHLARVLREYVAYCNRDRPHQALAQATPEPGHCSGECRAGPVHAVPVLGGLHHGYLRAA